MAKLTLDGLEFLKNKVDGHCLDDLNYSYYRESERMAKLTSDNSVSEHFIREFKEEASRQRIVFAKHDANKTPTEWFWLIGLLAGKALKSHLAGDKDDAKLNIIATAAACYNWYVAVCSE